MCRSQTKTKSIVIVVATSQVLLRASKLSATKRYIPSSLDWIYGIYGLRPQTKCRNYEAFSA